MLLPSQILEHSLAANRRFGWVPYWMPKHYANTKGGARCCFLTAMCRALQGYERGFALPEANEARQAMRDTLGIESIGDWNDTRHNFREIEEGVLRTVRMLRAKGR
jgi:hypothetical protein